MLQRSRDRSAASLQAVPGASDQQNGAIISK
jgi:hypothetical protein